MVYERVLRTVFPELCPRCDAATTAGFCAGCRRDFPRIDNPCPRCGLRRPVADCPRRKLAWSVDAVVAPFGYAAAVKRQLLALKFRAGRKLGRALGLLLADAAAQRDGSVDVLIPVPLHPDKLRARGYNQALEIGRGIASCLETPLFADGLRRLTAGIPQTGLGAADRRANLDGAFAARRGIHGLRVALIDDVITTGATINACAKSLRAGGAAGVEAWAVARTAE